MTPHRSTSPGSTNALIPMDNEILAMLDKEAEVTGLNRAQIIDNALRVWAFIQLHQETGGQIWLKHSQAAKPYRVIFEAGG